MCKEFYPVNNFPKLNLLILNWKTIQKEFYKLKAPLLNIHRLEKPHAEVFQEIVQHIAKGGKYGWLMGWTNDGIPNPNWVQYPLIFNEQEISFVSGMSQTMELLKQIKGIKVCSLITMKPHTYLPTHTHPEIKEEDLLQFHLTLDMDEGQPYSYLNVNGQFCQNEPGKGIVFDGSKEHFALNASNKDRTILYIEFDRKKLSAV